MKYSIEIDGSAITALYRDDILAAPEGAIPIPEAVGELLRNCSDFGGYVYTQGAVIAVAPPAPKRVIPDISRFQARGALYQAGLLPAVEALMALPATDMMARLAWADAQVFERNSLTVTSLIPALGLTDSQVDDLFIFASSIRA